MAVPVQYANQWLEIADDLDAIVHDPWVVTVGPDGNDQLPRLRWAAARRTTAAPTRLWPLNDDIFQPLFSAALQGLDAVADAEWHLLNAAMAAIAGLGQDQGDRLVELGVELAQRVVDGGPLMAEIGARFGWPRVYLACSAACIATGASLTSAGQRPPDELRHWLDLRRFRRPHAGAPAGGADAPRPGSAA